MDTANQVHRSALRLVRLLRDTQPGKGLGSAKLSVLGRLFRNGSTTATSLSAYLRIQPQSLTRLIADLERGGLIVRRKNDTDRRQSLLEITETGSRLLIEEIRDQRLALARTIATKLTPTEQELLRLAATLLDRLVETADAPAVAPGKPERRKGPTGS
jgi:DNA-binding MarR family transcriptional regulator